MGPQSQKIVDAIQAGNVTWDAIQKTTKFGEDRLSDLMVKLQMEERLIDCKTRNGERVYSLRGDTPTLAKEQTALEVRPAMVQDIDKWVKGIIISLPSLSEERLAEVAKSADQVANAGFKIRGACALEIVRRHQESRKNTGKMLNGQSIRENLAPLAERAGIAIRTLEDDYLICRRFKDELSKDNLLSREHFRLAMPYRNAEAMLEHARIEIKKNPEYSAGRFVADLKALRSKESHARVTTPSKAERRSLTVKLNNTGSEAMEGLKGWEDFDLNEFVNRTLTLEAGRVTGKPATVLQMPQDKRTESRLAQLIERARFDLKLANDAASVIDVPESLKAGLSRARHEVWTLVQELKQYKGERATA
jgi:hypothetical protein